MEMKKEKGSIAIFVLVALLFMSSFLIISYVNNVNKEKTIMDKMNIISQVYNGKNINYEETYNIIQMKNDTVEPTIPNIQNTIVINVTSAGGYVTNTGIIQKIPNTEVIYGATGGKTRYIAFDKEFDTMEDLLSYAKSANKYGEISINIKANANNGINASSNQNIELKRGAYVTNEDELVTALKTTNSLEITVGNDIQCNNLIEIDGVTHKLDLNNYKISYVNGNGNFAFITLGESTNLTVLDSSNEKQGTIIAQVDEPEATNTGNDIEDFWINTIINKGTLTLESGIIKADSVKRVAKANKGTNVTTYSTALKNEGTFNLNGGTVEDNNIAGACTYLAVKKAKSTGIGIENHGTLNLNSGIIKTNSEAYMQRGSGATVYGRTYAYAYGIQNYSGSADNIQFEVTANAHMGGTYGGEQEAESANIQN